jgi:hypothetical protein
MSARSVWLASLGLLCRRSGGQRRRRPRCRGAGGAVERRSSAGGGGGAASVFCFSLPARGHWPSAHGAGVGVSGGGTGTGSASGRDRASGGHGCARRDGGEDERTSKKKKKRVRREGERAASRPATLSSLATDNPLAARARAPPLGGHTSPRTPSQGPRAGITPRHPPPRGGEVRTGRRERPNTAHSQRASPAPQHDVRLLLRPAPGPGSGRLDRDPTPV